MLVILPMLNYTLFANCWYCINVPTPSSTKTYLTKTQVKINVFLGMYEYMNFDDAKEESNKTASKDKYCFKINTRLLKQTKSCFKITLRSSLASKQSDSKTCKALVVDYWAVLSIIRRQVWKIIVKKGFEFEFWTLIEY